jgi:selenocysteine-specific elongation factor
MFVIGTAGHIDHGKSVLIKRLTGIDPDRLREEKERGMTIDLGFAWLKLPSGNEVGIIDVPGHERFIKNMLAGVGSIDLALIVIAANEGVMPQTKEHLAILDLLRVKRGIVVITKKDLVDEELLSLVRMEIEDIMKPTTLADAPVIAVSAMTGEGVDELIATIDELLRSTEPRADMGRPRLLIDRSFTISGAGTVVTGTLIDGPLSQGEDIEIVPSGIKARIRGLQTHKTRLEKVHAGSRVAANLVGISTDKIERGDVLTRPGWLKPTSRVDVRLKLLDDITSHLRHGSVISFFVGAAEAIGKVHLLENEKLGPGESTWAQFSLDKPVAMVKDDHFIIRSPNDTLGGGIIVNSHARRHRRFRQDVIQNLETMSNGTIKEMIVAILELKQPLELGYIVVQCNLTIADVEKAVDELIGENKVIRLTGQGEHAMLFTDSAWRKLQGKAETIVKEYHRKFPARQGMPKSELNSKLGLSPHSPVLQRLYKDNILCEQGTAVRLPSYQVELTKEQQEKVGTFIRSLQQNPYSPPGDITVDPDILNLLIGQQRVVRVADGIVFSKAAYDEMVDRIIARAREQGTISLAEVRDMFTTSRKYAKALLEYMDEKKLTKRVGDLRVVK